MVAIKRILCPIDFSEFSQHAVVRAAAIAKAHDASITALHVVPFQPRYTPFPLEIETSPVFQLTPEERERVRRKLMEFAQAGSPGRVRLDAEVVDAYTVHDEIVAQAARLHADLIVMGTHGRSGFQRLLLGSITEKVLRAARQPVLTVGATDEGAPSPGSFKRVLCGIDFSECSLAALGYALTLAEGGNARVTAVNVIEWVPIGYDPLVGPPTDLVGHRMSAEATSRERLQKAIATANQKNVPVEEIVISGKPYREILRIANEQGSDLIVLGIHGRNPVDKMFFGSTAEPVVRRASCPVLTVRAKFAANVAAA
jgi:nucleotide-binding universal stress UspA family protein